ncbi:MAG TPA: acyl carrier protein [Pseudonocardiaceae bacterium]
MLTHGWFVVDQFLKATSDKGIAMSAALSGYDRKSVEEFVIEQVEATGADPDLIATTATLESLGLDSLDVVELSQGVKKQMGIPVSPKDFVDALTISDAIAVICRQAGIQ